ncbi:MAG: anti-sigma factor antagonist [Methanoregula sp.]|nr:anti-sigma factor antagonist [Methanoregula sp.]
MPEVLQIRQQKHDSVNIVSLSGRLDTNTSLLADTTLRQLIASEELQIVLNLENLNYISSSGLRVIIGSTRQLKKMHGDLKLACLKPSVKEIFHMTGFNRLFLFYDTVDTAIRSFSYVPEDENEQRIMDAVISTLNIEEERRRAEKDLQLSENMYRTIFENSGTAMAIVEDDLTIFRVNTEFERMAGYKNQELSEVFSLLSFIVRDDLAMVTEFHDLVRKNAGIHPEHFEFRFKDREGNVRNVYVNLDIIPNTPQRVYSLLDITELRKIEEDLRHELTRKREFIILTAHELRTPLQPVMGYLHMVLEDPENYGLNADAKAILGKCSENIDHVRGIIEHIIKLGGLGYGPEQTLPRFTPQYRLISPRQVLLSYTSVIRDSSDIAVDIRIRDDLKITTDSEYLFLIIQSLVFALLRFSPSPARIEISHYDDENTNYFTLENHGAVIAQEIVPNLFKPYIVGDESKLREKSGFIGLSLPVAKQMAEKLNGTITVTSTPGAGTRFTLALPKKRTPE